MTAMPAVTTSNSAHSRDGHTVREQLATGGIDIRCKDGNDYHVRLIRPDDAARVMRGYDALSERAKWFRVLHTLPHLTPQMAQNFATPDPDRVVAVVVEGRGKLAGELVGSARIADVGPGKSGEFSVTVRPEAAGLGLARQALQIVIDAAREAGCRSVWGSISIYNRPMIGLANRLGMTLRNDPDDTTLLIGELEL